MTSKTERRSGFQFSRAYLREKLDLRGQIYAVTFDPETCNVVFWCRDAKDTDEVWEGEPAPIVTRRCWDER